GVTAPYWEIPRPYQPSSKTFTSRVLGSTNPVWLDADGDGHFSPASVYAWELIKKFGSEPEKLQQALKEYDQAVADQVGAKQGASLIPGGTSFLQR
ncbi:MAG TPA: hypothetical protein VK956_20215, partial [Verrucomicrobium sp.]|nr:hypothetical protein [Verrucomicrobium sp.]